MESVFGWTDTNVDVGRGRKVIVEIEMHFFRDGGGGGAGVERSYPSTDFSLSLVTLNEIDCVDDQERHSTEHMRYAGYEQLP